MHDELVGYLNVCKPPRWTSHDVIARLRRLTGQRRIGHAGTLDPDAVGVLPVALGRATRTLGSPAWDIKSYWADVRFGSATDTDDADGRIIARGDPNQVGLAAVQAALASFLGTILQRPPAVSAVHVDGQRAYRRAWSGRSETPPQRPVRIDGIALVDWRPPVVSIQVQCRSGTYMRALARDLGTAVGCPAHLDALVRLRVGPFTIEDALDLRALERIAQRSAWDAALWSPDIAWHGLDAIIVSSAVMARMAGQQPHPAVGRQREGQPVRVYDGEGSLRGYAQSRGGWWQPVRAPRPSSIRTGGP